MPLHRRRHNLWMQYGKVTPTPYVVLIESGVVTPYPGLVNVSVRRIKGNAEVPNAVNSYTGADAGSGEGGRACFYGGRVYDITTAEATLLDAAGYTLYPGVYSDTYTDVYA